MTHIAVLIHAQHRLPHGALLAPLISIWRERGFHVSILHGTAQYVDADILVLHVDLTIVPEEYLRFAERYPVVVNGGVPDISKRVVSHQLVDVADAYDGPVILKTDRNNRGLKEEQLIALPQVFRKRARKVMSRLPWRWRTSLREYPVFESARSVPRGAWKNRHLVVERFLPERRDDVYYLRTWLFFGDQERMAIFHSPSPIVKSQNIVGREPLLDVPDDLREMRRSLRFVRSGGLPHVSGLSDLSVPASAESDANRTG